MGVTFFGDRAWAQEYDADGWPSRTLVRPLRRGDDRLAHLLRRRGMTPNDAAALAARVGDEWPSRVEAPGYVGILLSAVAAMALEIVGAVALVRLASRRIRGSR